jgi:hypothetical protein
MMSQLSLDEEKSGWQEGEMIHLWTWWVCTQEAASLQAGGHWCYNLGISTAEVEIETVD